MKNTIVRLIISCLALACVQTAAASQWEHLRVEANPEGGWRVITTNEAEPIVLAFGDQTMDMSNLSPEFVYLMDCYDAALAADPALQARSKAKRKVQFTNIAAMVKTSWAQGSPYYNMCPLYNGGTSRCVTGCVATAMAQVLNYHKLPKTMRGSKTYGYVNKAGKRVSHSFNFGATQFDWGNMSNSYSGFSSTASKNAVATLMYACGVATNMDYSPSESGANPWVGADGINCFMDGLRAEYKTFNTDDVLTELQAGRPVIFSGTNPNSGGGHCFVIDGARSDGYFHCNLGWGGGNDGYYLPTDMAGYSKSQAIVRVWPSTDRPSCTPIAELRGKYALAKWEPVTTLEPGKWYALWNAGRAGSPFSQGQGQTVINTSMLPTGESTIYNAAQLIRLVKRSNGGYYIQTGIGDYWGSMSPWGGECRTTASGTAYYNIAKIQTGYWSLSVNSQCFVDTNGPGGGIVGWNTAAPTDTVSNSSWRILPVTLSDEDLTPGAPPSFDAEATYTLQNTGYSQGYLVAISASDAAPTLRGVTQDHSAGLWSGALYHSAPDFESDGPFWKIETDGGQQYLKNTLTGKYLANTGNETCYQFTSTRTPINIARKNGDTFTLNSGTHVNSYLCAATQLENPAAFWTADDTGSEWKIIKAEKIVPNVAVTGVSMSSSELLLLSGKSVALQAEVVPANATVKTLLWSSSNPQVATVSAQGVVTGVGAGTAQITASSTVNTAARATCEVRVLKSTPLASLADRSDRALYSMQNTGQCQGYLVVLDASATAPTLRGVTTPHPSQGCCNDDYLLPVDFMALGCYWQILSEEGKYYLYNPLTEKYLANTGNETSYELTAEPTPINISVYKAGVYRFNTGTHATSYLCAATHLENPAAYWNSMDKGTEWEVCAVEGLNYSPVKISLNPGLENSTPAYRIYDTQGREILLPKRGGLYIQNRKKLLHK